MMIRNPKILAIDDDSVWLEQIPIILEGMAEVHCYETIDQALLAIESQFYDIVFLDINFEGDNRTGLDVFRKVSSIDHESDVIVISGETKPERLIQVMNAGITQFLTKPASPDQIRQAVRDILLKREMRLRAINQAKIRDEIAGRPVTLIGSSNLMERLQIEIRDAVESGAKDILLLGETGTGKEVVAKAIAQAADPSKRLIPIHCGAISDGIAESELFGHVKGAFTGADRDRASAFEAVGGGFVFFDEIGDMPLNQQAKLLRVLQERKVQRVGSLDERPVHFRSISATNINMENAISQKRFREDLYYRISKFTIKIPSLRERIEDVPELVHHFLGFRSSEKKVSITNEAIQLLQSYAWPGNIRQLEAVIEIMAHRCTNKIIREKDVCHAVPELADLFTTNYTRSFLGKRGATFVSAEKKRFQKALVEAGGNRDKAAELLNVSRATFFRRAKELGLSNPRSRQLEN